MHTICLVLANAAQPKGNMANAVLLMQR